MHLKNSIAVLCLSLTWLACGTPPSKTDDAGAPMTVSGPRLEATVPANGATNVNPEQDLVLQFSAAVDPSSVTVSVSPTATAAAAVVAASGLEASVELSGLASATRYTVTVTARDAAGTALEGEASFSFTTAAMIDTTPPTLVSSLPAHGAVDVPTTTTLVLTFSEPMQPDSLVLTAVPSVGSTAQWSAQNTVATLTLAAPLEALTEYEFQYNAADLAGNLAVGVVGLTTAAPPDTDAPVVKVSAPEAGATMVPTNAVLSITFNEAMQKPTVDGAFSITPSVAGTVLWDDTNSLRSFQPSAPLTPSTQYTITIGTDAKDAAGNALAAPFVATFTTAAAPDTTRPTLVSNSPTTGEHGVIQATNIVLTFSEPMDQASAQVAFSVTAPMGVTGTFSWSADGRTMTFNPTQSFAYGALVAWRIANTARDLAGNTLLQTLSRGFEVRKLTTVVFDSVPVFDGWVSNSMLVSEAGGIIVGDNSSNIGFRGMVGFDMSSLPADVLAIKRADIYLYQNSWSGNPRGTLGGQPRIERVNMGATLDHTDYGAPAFMGVTDSLVFGTPSDLLGWKVTQTSIYGVTADFAQRATRNSMTQWRLRFPNELSANAVNDNYTYYAGNTATNTCARQAPATGSSCKPYLLLSYEHE